MSKEYSEIPFLIDLISEVYKTSNPAILSEKIEEEFDISVTIHQIQDYLELNKEDYEKESRKQYYHAYY